MAKILYFILLVLVGLVAYIKYLERRGIYFPQKDIIFYPSTIRLPFEDVYFKTRDGLTLNGWFIPQEKTGYTVLFVHGNAGNISHRMEKVIMLREVGVNIFIMDYRGFGKSQGRVSERGLYLDAQGAYDYLVRERNIKPVEVIVYGESIGTAVAIDLAATVEVKGVILEGVFSRGRDMAKTIYPFLPASLFADSFNNLEKIKKVRVPKLFIHSKNDEIVPFVLAQRLYNASPEPKELIELEGGHNSAFFDSKEKYVSTLALWIKKLSMRGA